MGYSDERQRIINYVTNDGLIIELTPNRSNEKMYYQVLERFHSCRELAIRYPGYKTTKTKCDYCVYLVEGGVEKPVSHIEIMQDLYEKTTLQNYKTMKSYIEAVAEFGKGIPVVETLQDFTGKGFSFEELTSLMFYIAIQEDINYPEQYYQGRKMCFYRYLEAVYCKIHTNHSLNEAMEKAVARGYTPKKWNDVGDLYDTVSGIHR